MVVSLEPLKVRLSRETFDLEKGNGDEISKYTIDYQIVARDLKNVS